MQQVSQFVDFLLAENEKYNLSAVRTKDDAYLRYVHDHSAVSRVEVRSCEATYNAWQLNRAFSV
jgi:16S rRNA G527 N7-methylase RsmG